MANQKLSKIIRITSRIFTSLVSLCILLLLLITFLSDKPNSGGDWIAFAIMCLAILLFIPVYGLLLKKMGEGVAKIIPYITGGLFIIRLLIFAFLTLSVISMFGEIKSNAISVLNISASKGQVDELLDHIENDNYYDLLMQIQDLEYNDRQIDYIPLVAKIFETVIIHSGDVASIGDYEAAAYGLLERLGYFNTLEEIKASIDNYSESPYKDFISEVEMIELLIEYGELCSRIEMIDMARDFFDMASQLDPENMDLLLAQADALYNQHYLQESVELYNRYMSLMRNDGKDRQIPSRVREFVRSELYGQNLQTRLIENWINEYPASDPEDVSYYEDDGIEHVIINNKLFVPLWSNARHLLYGYEYWNDIEDEEHYYGLSGAFARIMDREPKNGDHSAFEILSGIDFLSSDEDEFLHVNEEIIVWAQRNLIPHPDLRVLGFSCQTLYDVLLKDLFRDKALGYFFLTYLFSPEEDAWEYEEEMYEDYFYGYDFLSDKYHEAAYDNTDDYEEAWTLVVEAGFWLRRIIDGSYDACWNALEEVMDIYDYEYYEYGLNRDWEYYEEEYYDDYEDEDYYEEEEDYDG